MEHINILLVSDDHDYVDALAVRLQARGLTVQISYGVDAALKKMQHSPSLDVVILISCGHVCPDAYTVLDTIKAAEQHTKVIVLGEHEDADAQEEALRHGAFAYLPKTEDPSDMKGIDSIMKSIHMAFKQNVGDALVAASLAEGGAFAAADEVLAEEEQSLNNS